MFNQQISVSLYQQQDYRFRVIFDERMPVLLSDEPAPLGTGLGPSPLQMLCAAVGNCLSETRAVAMHGDS